MATTTQNYKRTIAGSVGAGMGALFNASGRTYYMLEHKTNTKFHNAGDSQKIIIDEIELGRDGGCQVRFDESCETVSRKHAAIQRDGENWKLIHLSQSNPTFVNGQPVDGERILQSGDEIQLSANGPRMGFIVPQGKQALTSSISLTERMGLFRQQALAPYKRALWAMGILLVLVIAGFGYWNYTLGKQNQALQEQLIEYQAKSDSLNNVQNALVAEISDLDDKIAHSTGSQRTIYIQQRAAAQEKLNSAKQESERINEAINEIKNENPEVAAETPAVSTPEPAADDVIEVATDGAEDDIENYNDCVYTLKIDNIKVSYNGVDIEHGVANPGVVGNGFLIDNGNFVTARQNVQPWIYSGVITDGVWRDELAQYFALGCDIEIQYSAYSAQGAAKKFTFNSRDFQHPADYVTKEIEITKTIRKIITKYSISVSYTSSHRISYQQFASHSSCYAVIRGLSNTGIPTSKTSMEGGRQVKVAGYTGWQNVHNLGQFRYITSTTTTKDTNNGTYTLQDGGTQRGYLGSPAFVKDSDGKYRVVGVFVGSLFGEPRIVPISRCK